MPRTLSWIVWGAVVVAGSILSFEVWKQALEPTPSAVAPAPTAVHPSGERVVTAIAPPKPSGAGSHRGSSRGRSGGLFGGSFPVVSLAPGASGGAAILLPGLGGGGGGVGGGGGGGTSTSRVAG